MHEELEAAVQIGQVLAAKYRVERVLGVGGMGVVVAATHLQLDQMVALKFVRREAMATPEIVSRFEREARAAVRLKSEHVARIIDVGRLETGSPYIVMEHLEGQDLAVLLAQQGALSVSTACDLIVQACDAIAEAHGLGIVHRDLKPGNLFLAHGSHGQQIIKILDFGISKSPLGGDWSMTQTQAVMGSPGYMSPEQMRSTKNVDGRTDLWSLGVILYELVAGRVPFQADTFTALCLKVAMDRHPPLPALGLRAELPPGFEEVVNRALEKDPAQRYQSAAELASALAPFGTAQTRERALRLGSSPASAAAGGAPRFVPATSAQSTLHAAAGQVPATRQIDRSRLWKWVLAGIGICAAAGIGIGASVLHGGGGGGGVADSSAIVTGSQPGASDAAPGGARPDGARTSGAAPADARPTEPPPDAVVAASPHAPSARPSVPAPVDTGIAQPPPPEDVRDARRGTGKKDANDTASTTKYRHGGSAVNPFETSE